MFGACLVYVCFCKVAHFFAKFSEDNYAINNGVVYRKRCRETIAFIYISDGLRVEPDIVSLQLYMVTLKKLFFYESARIFHKMPLLYKLKLTLSERTILENNNE